MILITSRYHKHFQGLSPHKRPCNFRVLKTAWPKNPLLFANYIYYIYFYITLNKRKKWESGPRCPQTLVLPRFRWPTFDFKNGPKVKKSGPKSFSVRTNPSMAQIKVGQTHFQISISGPKRRALVKGLRYYLINMLSCNFLYLTSLSNNTRNSASY